MKNICQNSRTYVKSWVRTHVKMNNLTRLEKENVPSNLGKYRWRLLIKKKIYISEDQLDENGESISDSTYL